MTSQLPERICITEEFIVTTKQRAYVGVWCIEDLQTQRNRYNDRTPTENVYRMNGQPVEEYVSRMCWPIDGPFPTLEEIENAGDEYEMYNDEPEDCIEMDSPGAAAIINQNYRLYSHDRAERF